MLCSVAWKKIDLREERIRPWVRVANSILPFQSTSLSSAFSLLRDMAGHNGSATLAQLLEGTLAFALFPVVWFFPNTQQILGQESNGPTLEATPTILRDPAPNLLPRLRWTPTLSWALLMAVLFFAVLVNLDSSSSFLYFQF